ncbi:tRNA pseudouridine(38-40) synthase TruA [Aureispira anguillae]|uniref:tRNA pseudouridine synthase A n=1 Tax=Aureispira anguillae TaxID=2864201 RepID=A0A916DUR0_9BACT|nr:tRNA pseudouridine(38-40) synthase TruA [Aureispira anguillae]BDS12461.1 tRNA pseudouridine(38-40) synthase TruA [Aureispira anguillae]
MTRYFFHIAYNGTHYRGWQRQPNVRSVQEVLETKLAQALKLPAITIIGCGRTDAGVHASQFFFHTDLAVPLRENFVFVMNKILPPSIAIFEIITIDSNLHARFSAVERVYDYFIHNQKDPFTNDISSLYVDYELDLNKMKKAVALLPKYKDYKAFCKQPDLHNTTLCDVRSAKLFCTKDHKKIRFQITANRFLRGQIRILVQKLLEIGTDKYSIDEFEQNLATQQRPQLIRPAHPQGLFLSKIVYPGLDLVNQANFTLPEDYWQAL